MANAREWLRQKYLGAHERYHDRRLGIRTRGLIPLATRLDAPGRNFYVPVTYGHLWPLLARLPAGREDVLLDYGCGLGRVLVAAATRAYRSVIGIELVPELVSALRENVRRALPRLVCRDVRIIEADAATYSVPDEVTLITAYNPFSGAVLDQTLDRVEESLGRCPRSITVLFWNRKDFARAIAGRPWVRTLEEGSLRRWPPTGYGFYECRLN